MNQRQYFTSLRSRPTLDFHKHLRELESEFGKYLYVPFDVPKIGPNDPEAFKSWYYQNAKGIKKIGVDIAGPPIESAYDESLFVSIDSRRQPTGIWDSNVNTEMNDLFPEIMDGVREHLPFLTNPEYMLWSSTKSIAPHRDQGPWNDLPCSFRVMLLDENPAETLFIQECPADYLTSGQQIFPSMQVLPRAKSNSFAWNNLRTKHGSVFVQEHRKILMIITSRVFDVQKYKRLMERSVQKNIDSCLISKFSLSDFADS